jgi:PIN domain nuclease of toxin-antitoxin system
LGSVVVAADFDAPMPDEVMEGFTGAIKSALGRLQLAEAFAVLVAADDFTELPMTLAHASRLQDLPAHHTDPFDRKIAAQALAERATLVTHDGAFASYGVKAIWT